MTETTNTKRRIDAWDASLTEAQRWTVFYHMRRWTWAQAAEWAAKEYSLEAVPSRSAMYRFYGALQPLESDQRLLDSISAGNAAADLARTATDDETTVDAYKALAQGLSLSGDAKSAMMYTRMALDIAAQQTKTRELELKTAAQKTKDSALKLAREKFEAAEARATAAETRADAAEAKATALQVRCKELETALADAGKTSVADPSKVAEEMDRVLGRKKS